MAMNFEQFAREAFDSHGIEWLVNDVLDAHRIGRRTVPLCKVCRVEMTHIKDDLYQCPKCKVVEAL